MKTGVILIDNTGNGFENAVAETRKAAEYEQLSGKNVLQLELITEEMLSLVRSVTGEMKASFWIEAEDGQFDLHLNTKTVMDKEKRYQLISSAAPGKTRPQRPSWDTCGTSWMKPWPRRRIIPPAIFPWTFSMISPGIPLKMRAGTVMNVPCWPGWRIR